MEKTDLFGVKNSYIFVQKNLWDVDLHPQIFLFIIWTGIWKVPQPKKYFHKMNINVFFVALKRLSKNHANWQEVSMDFKGYDKKR